MPASGHAASSRRQLNDDDDFLEQLDCLRSARSNSSRHTWRSGLIPPCLDPPYRIPSHFPVPRITLSQLPGLNHPDLNRGQRRYLYSTAQIYSMESTKRALSDSYYGLLMSELMKGGGKQDSHRRYGVWIYGNHKRLFVTNPEIWRSPRKSKSEREATTDTNAPETPVSTVPDEDSNKRRSASVRSANRTRRKSPSHPASAKKLPQLERTTSPQEQAPLEKQPQPPPPPPPLPAPTSQQPQRRLQSAGRARSARQLGDEIDVEVSRPQPPTQARTRTSAGRGSSRAGYGQSKTDASGKAEDEEREGVEENRPRDLSKILY